MAKTTFVSLTVPDGESVTSQPYKMRSYVPRQINMFSEEFVQRIGRSRGLVLSFPDSFDWPNFLAFPRVAQGINRHESPHHFHIFHFSKMMKRYLLLLCIFLKHTFASLLYPINLYNDDASKNYLYERACHHYSSELSTARYESPQVRSKVFDSLYLKCLAVIWPNCEVTSANNMIVLLTNHETFEKGQAIVYNTDRKPVKYAHRRGFFAENLLEPDHRRFIFWDSLAPMTDLHKFT